MIEDLDDFVVDSAIQNQINKVLDRSEMIQIVLNKLLTNDRTITSDIDINIIEKIIDISLVRKKMDIDYEFLIYDKELNKIIISNSENPKILKSAHFQLIYPQNDLIDSNLDLYIYFPDKDKFIGENNFYSLMFSVLFIVLIALCFYYVFLKLFDLKKLSEIKNDFIDNMTHELKTPISTISLACEALLDEDVKPNQKNKKYVTIIDKENARLGSQVERVLDIAKTEKDSYRFELKSIDIHKIINSSLNIIEFKISKNKGKILKKLDAENNIILGNERHLLNVINNLLDNANKYSMEPPEILCRDKKFKEYIDVSIRDNGVGIKKSSLNKIFDKFYREPQGNVHNVKGFGLGLSYVKNILDKHNAKISVNSKINVGTEFNIKFIKS